MRPSNPLGLFGLLQGEYDKTSQPLTERASILPFGQYEDGSVGMAFPGLLAAPAEAWKRMVDTSRASPVLDDTQVGQMSRDSFDAAGGAMTGGFAAGVGGGLADNALGSAGSNITSMPRRSIPEGYRPSTARDNERRYLDGLSQETVRRAGADVPPGDLRGSAQGFINDMANKNMHFMEPFDTFGNGPDAINVARALSAHLSDNPALTRPYEVTFDRGASGTVPGSYQTHQEWADAIKNAGDTDRGDRLYDRWQAWTDRGGGQDPDQPVRQTMIPQYNSLEDLNRGGQGVRIKSGTSTDDILNWMNESRAAGTFYSNAKTGAAVPLATNALERQPGIRAYHGSPHDFDQFSLDKIGSGEGAQAYGHGLYFADSENVARSYRDALRPESDYDFYLEGEKVTAKQAQAIEYLQATGRDPTKAKELMSKDFDPDDGQVRKLENLINDMAQVDWEQRFTDPGRMYEVNINADPADFLDWDKPLSQQSEAVQAAVKSDPLFGMEMYQEAPDNLMRNLLRDPNTTQALREAGIPGIRYLDGMSRGAGEGSSNYVVFDDALVDILRKYSNAPTGAAIPAGMEASQDQDTDPAILEYLRLMSTRQ